MRGVWWGWQAGGWGIFSYLGEIISDALADLCIRRRIVLISRSSVQVPLEVLWPAGDSEAASLVRSHDWSATSLGPSKGWQQSLKTVVEVVLGCSFPMVVLWGPDLVQVYNDGYRELMGRKHPAGMGQATQACWPEAWSTKGPIYARVLAGETLKFEDELYPVLRRGDAEQGYFTACYSPLRDEFGVPSGVLVTVFETTERVKADGLLRTNETRLREVIQQSPAIFAVLRGPQHVLETINRPYQEFIGAREVLGKPIREALPETVEQDFTQVLDRVYETGQAYTAHGSRIRIDRQPGRGEEERYVDLVYQPIREVDGAVSGIIVQGVDVTASKLAAAALAEKEADLKWTLALSPHIPWTADPAGGLVELGERWTLLTGLTREQSLGDGWMKATNAEDVELVGRRWRVAVERGEVFDVEYRLRLADGTFRWTRMRGYPRREADGRVVRWYGITEDIEERKVSELALVQAEKLMAVGKLASSIAHEINNPLEAVTNLLYLARTSKEIVGEVLTYVLTAEAELGRISQITTQTLRFHKQSTRRLLVGCADLIGGALEIYLRRIADKGIVLEKRKRAHKKVICYEGEIRQVLNNLIANSIDAISYKGGRLLLRSREATDWKTGRAGLVITVADNGSGMTMRTQRRIFEPFFTTKGLTGTGLGLWVSCEIVVRHKGELRVRSSQRPGQSGTVFTMFLPYDSEPDAMVLPEAGAA